MIGMMVALNGLKEMERHRGRGGVDYTQTPSEENYFLADCLDIITECSKMPAMEDTIVPVTTTKKRTIKQKKKGEPKQEEHSIYFAKINKETGKIKLDGFESPIAGITAIGMIDDDKMFVYSPKGLRYKPEINVFTVQEYKYDDRAEKWIVTNDVLKNGITKDYVKIKARETRVSGPEESDITYLGTTTMSPRKEIHTSNESWIHLANVVGKMRRECLAKNRDATEAEMGM